jgi:hypothetical protein
VTDELGISDAGQLGQVGQATGDGLAHVCVRLRARSGDGLGVQQTEEISDHVAKRRVEGGFRGGEEGDMRHVTAIARGVEVDQSGRST